MALVRLLLPLLTLGFVPLAFAEWVYVEGRVSWHERGSEVVAFDYGEAVDLPTIVPLRIPGGLPLLAESGVRLVWQRINGESYVGPQATGRVVWKEPVFEELPSGGLVIRIRIDYLNAVGRRELAEYRDLVISEIGRNGKYRIDWTSHFTAGEAGALLENSENGYSGPTLSLSPDAAPASFVQLPTPRDADPADPGVDWPRTQAVATHLYPDERHPGSIAVMADPRSTVGPHAWSLEDDPERPAVVAALLRSGPRELEAGEVWEISYRMVVRPKQWDLADLRLEFFRWLSR